MILAYLGDIAVGCGAIKHYCKQHLVGKGIGGRLMERCVLEASKRQHDGIYLTVWEHNQRAQDFYKKWSYESCALIDISLGTAPLRDLVMQKMLSPLVTLQPSD